MRAQGNILSTLKDSLLSTIFTTESELEDLAHNIAKNLGIEYKDDFPNWDE